MAGYGKGGYGKKPLWFWILLYVVIGGLIYYLVYRFYFMKNGYNYNPYSGTTQNQSNSY